MDDAQRLSLIGDRAAQLVENGSVVGLGTGSTVDAMLMALGRRVKEGLTFTGVATSERTKNMASELAIPLLELNDVERLDICIDGADEIDPDLNLVKGRGGALLFEKIVALSAMKVVIIASSEKLVSSLGSRLPLPVEVVPFGWKHTASEIAKHRLVPILRRESNGAPFISDGGHFILDCAWSGADTLWKLDMNLKLINGVVDHGLFVGMATLALTVDEAGIISEHTPRHSG